MSVPRGECHVLERLVDRFDRKDALEARVDVREDGHDCGPDQGAVIVLRGLWERDQSYSREESYEVTRIELDV